MKKLLLAILAATLLVSCSSPVDKLINLFRELDEVSQVRTGDLPYDHPDVQKAEARAEEIRLEMQQLVKDNETYELTNRDRELILHYNDEQSGKKMTLKERSIVLESRTLGGLFYAFE